MAPPISSAIAMMPGITTASISCTKATTSSTGLLSSATPSSTLHSTQTSLNSTLSTTAITPTTEPTPTSNGKMKKLGIGLGVGIGVAVLALLLWGIYKLHRRREGREKYHKSLARAHIDAWNTANRAHTHRWASGRNRTENPAHGEQGVGSSAESAKTESIPMRDHMLASSEAVNRRVQTLATSEAVPTIVRALTSPGAVTTRVQTLATSENVPTIARTLATSEAGLTRVHTLSSSEGDIESRPASGLPTAVPNSQIEREELATDSPVDAEPTPELGPDTSGSDTSESDQRNPTPPQPTTSTRSKSATPAQLDGTSSSSPDTDMMTRVPTAEGGSKSHNEPAQDEATAPAKPAESLQVEGEVERQWSWQQGDDEHLQRSLEARFGLDEQVQHVQESPEELIESEQ